MSETKLNIFQKLAKIRQMVEVIQKNKKGFNYSYVGEDEILAKAMAGMDKYGISLVPKLDQETIVIEPRSYTKTTYKKDGGTFEETINEFFVKGPITFVWVNDENPTESIAIPWYMTGQQKDSAQAFGSALTYATRYFWLKYFNIATPDDDPDNWKMKKETAAQKEDAVICGEIIKLIDETIKAQIALRPEMKEGLEKVVKGNVRVNNKPSGNYFQITDAKMASDTLAAVKKYFKLDVDSVVKESKED